VSVPEMYQYVHCVLGTLNILVNDLVRDATLSLEVWP